MSDVLRVLNELESRNSPKVKSARKIIQLTKVHDLFSECKLYGQAPGVHYCIQRYYMQIWLHTVQRRFWLEKIKKGLTEGISKS